MNLLYELPLAATSSSWAARKAPMRTERIRISDKTLLKLKMRGWRISSRKRFSVACRRHTSQLWNDNSIFSFTRLSVNEEHSSIAQSFRPIDRWRKAKIRVWKQGRRTIDMFKLLFNEVEIVQIVVVQSWSMIAKNKVDQRWFIVQLMKMRRGVEFIDMSF